MLLALYGFEPSFHFYALALVSIILIKVQSNPKWVVYAVAFGYLCGR